MPTRCDRFAETRRLQARWVTASLIYLAVPCLETQLLREEAHAAYATEQASALVLAKLAQRQAIA
jgi:hypothetical protein